VTIALKERLERVRGRSNPARDLELDEIFARASRILPRDTRIDDEIVGYNAEGLFD
jgi:hypothetical protein